MIRIAAVGDVHFDADSSGALRPALDELPDRADLLLLAGDLTRRGTPEEARVLAKELAGIGVPVFAVLGNHDYHEDHQDEVTRILEDVGCRVLEGEGETLDVAGVCVGVAGVKGFGGGFPGAFGSEFGEPEMKLFARTTKVAANALQRALEGLACDHRVALMHYSPIRDTLEGEPLEIFPFLGSYLLAEAVDNAGADLVLHGHAHRGVEKGMTPGGIHVRNVAQSVINRPYTVYRLGDAA